MQELRVDLSSLSGPRVLDAMRTLGYPVDAAHLIIGVRSRTYEAGFFDDAIVHVISERESPHRVNRVMKAWAATTDPGSMYLKDPARVDGTGVVELGHYPEAYVEGEHKGNYAALVQRGRGPIRYKRVLPADLTIKGDRVFLDTTAIDKPVKEGWVGANIHASDSDPFDEKDKERGVDGKIYKYSAMCQVFANSSDYREHWALVQRFKREFYDYTLLSMEQLGLG